MLTLIYVRLHQNAHYSMTSPETLLLAHLGWYLHVCQLTQLVYMYMYVSMQYTITKIWYIMRSRSLVHHQTSIVNSYISHMISHMWWILSACILSWKWCVSKSRNRSKCARLSFGERQSWAQHSLTSPFLNTQC